MKEKTISPLKECYQNLSLGMWYRNECMNTFRKYVDISSIRILLSYEFECVKYSFEPGDNHHHNVTSSVQNLNGYPLSMKSQLPKADPSALTSPRRRRDGWSHCG